MARKKQTESVEDILEPKKSNKPDAAEKKQLLSVTGDMLTAKDIAYCLKVLIPNEAHKASMSEKEMFDKLNMLCNKYKLKERVTPGCGGLFVSDTVKKIVEAYNGR